MKYDEKITCIVLSNRQLYDSIKKILKNDYYLFHSHNLLYTFKLIRGTVKSCVIIHIVQQSPTIEVIISQLRTTYPFIPIIGIIDVENLELIWFLGNNNIRHYITLNNINEIEKKVQLVTVHMQTINWSQFSINKNICPALIQRTLKLLEKNYHNIHTVNDIANRLNISREQLSRKFSEYCGIGIKRLLMALKLNDAIRLLQNNSLSQNEIAILSGFLNKRQYFKYFRTVFCVNVKEYRDNGGQISLYDTLKRKLVKYIYHNCASNITNF